MPAARHPNFKHGGPENPLYRTWLNMRQRCSNPNNKSWKNYGARGITVCKRWDDFLMFVADMGPKPYPEATVERKDNDKGYSPDNCVWRSRSEQMHNVRYNRWIEFDGEVLILSDWAKRLGITPPTLWWRLTKYSVEVSLTMKGTKNEFTSSV